MGSMRWGAGAAATLREHVLRAVASERPRGAGEIPREWPVLRLHVERALRGLMEEGLIESECPGDGSLRLTRTGRLALGTGD